MNAETETETRARAVDDEAADAVLAELVERFIDRLHDGEAVEPGAFAAEHPEHAGPLLALLPVASTMAGLRRSALAGATPPPGLPRRSEVIGGYRVVREVGRGGMGVVYEAERVSTGQRVALKVLSTSPTTDPRLIQRFAIEGRAASALDHPNIVPVYEVGREGDIHYYAMPFVDGCSLASLIGGARSGAPSPFGPREAARLAFEAAGALAHAHALGIVHRDVKPANLLLDADGRLWVADFGLAGFLDGGDLTLTGDVIGTLRYLSPEQAEGRRGTGPRTDVYGLGATLYELTTLRPAFDGHDRRGLLRRIERDDPIPPRRVDPTIPRDLETIVLKAMAKEPEARYAGAAELADDLRRFLESRPILARRPGPARRAARWARRNRGAVAAAAVVLALFLIGLGAGVGLLWRERARTRENLRLAMAALDEFCLAADGPEPARDPERTQRVHDLQLKALAIYERMLRQNPGDPEARWAAARAEHRVANLLANSPRPAEAGPAYRAAHQDMALLRRADPGRLDHREEAADILADWGAWQPAGMPEARRARREALADHLRLASEFPGEPRFRRAVARDCIEVARSVGIGDPAEALEKEALFRRAVAIRGELEDRSFETKAEHAEALAYLGHLLNATRRTAEGAEVMARGKDLLATLASLSAGEANRRHRLVALEGLFATPRYCERSGGPDEILRASRSTRDGHAGLVAEFPTIPEFRAELAWAEFGLASGLMTFGRPAEAETSFRRSIGLFEGLLRDHSTVDHYRRYAAITSEGLGDLLVASGRAPEAAEHFRRAYDLSPEGGRGRPRLARKLEGTGPERPAGPISRPGSEASR